MGHKGKVIAIWAGGILAGLVLLFVLLSAISWNFARPWLAERISSATERSFVIEGDLDLRWSKPEGMYGGWRDAIPWPHFRAQDVALGNPDWAKSGPHMLRAPQVDFSLNPFGLFRRQVTIPVLHLSNAELNLEIAPDGRNNWRFAEREQEGRWQVELEDLALDNGRIRLLNRNRPADVTAQVQTDADGASWMLEGEVDGEEVKGEGRAGGLRALRADGVAYPFQGQVSIGESEVRAEGTLTNPRRPSEVDVKLDVRGASMAQLFPWTGVALPKTPRFSTSGRLVGNLDADQLALRYEDFQGRMGNSRIGGTLAYRRQAPRPMLSGDITVPQLDLADLRRLAGTGETEEEGRVIPARPFGLDRWTALDADVKVAAEKIERGDDAVPIDSLSAHVQLKDGRLLLDPLALRLADGRVRSRLEVDGRREPAQGKLSVNAQGLRLEQLFPKVEGLPASVGAVSLRAELAGAGDSLAALAGNADGEVRAFVTEGTISKLALEAMGLNIGSVVVAKLFGDRQVQLHCLASDFEVSEGVMQTRLFVVDTADALVGVDGSINLGSEELALEIRQEAKGPRVFALQSPLHVRGSFSEPQIGVDAGAVGLQAGAAALLGAIAAPLAGLLALIDVGEAEQSPCPQLLERAKQAPRAKE